MKTLVAGLAALAAGAVVAPLTATAEDPPDIVDVVLDVSGTSGFDSNGADYDLLREALLATELAGAVKNADDITVFAPNDDAFQRTARELGFSGSGEAEAFAFLAGYTGFNSAGDPGLLDDVLLFHVAPDADTVRELRFSGRIPTLLDGASVKVFWNSVIDGDRNDPNARIIAPKDLRASNGIIQTVDRVLRPVDLEPAPPSTVVDVVVEASGSDGFDRNLFDYDLLREALEAADLVGAVQSATDINVFAPTDGAFISLARQLGYDGYDEQGAFGKIAEATGYASPADPGLLDDVLLYHVAPDARTIAELRGDGDIPTLLGGATVDVGYFRITDQDTDDRDPLIGFPRDVETGNGNVHTIYGVLRPVDLP